MIFAFPLIVTALVAGCVIPFAPALWMQMALGSSCGCVGGVLVWRHKTQKAFLFLILLGLGCGWLIGQAMEQRYQDLEALSKALQQESKIVVRGVIKESVVDATQGYVTLAAQQIYLKTRGSVVEWREPLIALRLPKEKVSAWQRGDELLFLGHVEARSKDNASYHCYLLRHRIVAQMRSVQTYYHQPKLARSLGDTLWRVRYRALHWLDEDKATLGHDHVEILKAWLLGVRQGLDPELKKAFRKSGTYHMFAISGMHVMLFYSFVMIVLLALRCPWPLAVLVMMLALAMLVMITGASSSVMRASLMVVIALGARSMGRALRIETIFWMALLILIVINPFQLMQLGFQMSFLAVAVIVITLKLLKLWKRSRWPIWLKNGSDVWAVSCALLVGMAPVMAATFGYVVCLSPLSNLCVAPLMTLGMCGGLGVLLSRALGLDPLMGWLSWLTGSVVLKNLVAIVEFWAQWEPWFVTLKSIYLVSYYFLIMFIIVWLSGSSNGYGFRDQAVG